MFVEDPETKRTEVYLQRIVRYPDEDASATSAVNTILFDYLNSRIKGSLSDVFVENSQIATSVHVSATALGAGVMWFTISATLEEGVDPAPLKGAFESFLTDLKARGVDEATVNRLKRRRTVEIADAGKEPQRALSALTNWFFAARSYADWGLRAKNYEDVTPAKVQKMIDIMASPGRQLFGVLAPKGAAE